MANDPSIQQYMQQQRQQQFWNMLMQAGQGLLSANKQGQPPLRALSTGLARAGSARGQGTGGLLDWMKMREYTQGQEDRQQKQEREQRQYDAQDMLSSGALASARQPAGMGLSLGRSLLEREKKGLLGVGYPDIAGRARAAEIYPKPDTLSPEAEAQKIRMTQASRVPATKYGSSKFDTNVGKWYQEDQSGKRHYTSSPTGMEITTPEGLTIRTGVPRGGAGGMQKKTRGDIEKKLVGAREGLARLRDIATKFKPEFQEIPTRLGVAWTGLKSRFGQGGISPEDRQSLTEFADYRRGALSNINLYIKDITGAQMSATETDRLRKAIPDPGEGIFGGDDPITFKANLDSAIRDIEKAAVRYEYYLSKGITDVEVMARQSPLGEMEVYVNPQTGERIVEIAGQWVPLK